MQDSISFFSSLPGTGFFQTLFKKDSLPSECVQLRTDVSCLPPQSHSSALEIQWFMMQKRYARFSPRRRVFLWHGGFPVNPIWGHSATSSMPELIPKELEVECSLIMVNYFFCICWDIRNAPKVIWHALIIYTWHRNYGCTGRDNV